MLRKPILKAAPFMVAALSLVGAACSAEPVRLDASSDAAAKKSFDRMEKNLSPKLQRELIVAMVKLNMVGVNSAYDVVANPELQSPSIVRIKDRVAGMTAEEIIDLADRTSTVKVDMKSK